jgi:ferritin-like protein
MGAFTPAGTLLIAALAVAATLACEARAPRLEWVFKPLASACFIALALQSGAPDSAYGQVLLVGLLLCLGGDVLLIPTGNASFRAGLGSFLLGHVAYVFAFLQLPRNDLAMLVGAVPAAALAYLSLRWLRPHVPPAMRLPLTPTSWSSVRCWWLPQGAWAHSPGPGSCLEPGGSPCPTCPSRATSSCAARCATVPGACPCISHRSCSWPPRRPCSEAGHGGGNTAEGARRCPRRATLLRWARRRPVTWGATPFTPRSGTRFAIPSATASRTSSIAGGSSMANEGYHEPVGELSDATRDMHRAIISLMEELEAVDWYNQRVDACRDDELKAILAHNRDEEKEHAAMVLEWIRRRDPTFDKELRDFLFTDKPIAHG